MQSSTIIPRLASISWACSTPWSFAMCLLSSSNHLAYSMSNITGPELVSPGALHPPGNMPCEGALCSSCSIC
uniref:Uncharacterized protein n=1 Tax=Arundo donax TaxID=35708 RepID=A0A0A9FZ42_ARUDO